MKIRSITTTNLCFKTNYKEAKEQPQKKPTICKREYFPNGKIKEERYSNGTIVGYNNSGDAVFQIIRRNTDKK